MIIASYMLAIDEDLVFCYVTVLVDAVQTTTQPPAMTTRGDTGTTTQIPPPQSIDVTTITSSGATTAGENYTLECSVIVTGSTDQPSIIWLVAGVEVPSSDPTRTVLVTSGSAGSYSNTLTFHPLAASHAGTYTCRATVGSAMDTASRTVTVQSKLICIIKKILCWQLCDIFTHIISH